MPVRACSQWPSVSEANGDIRITARPCNAMFSVAATSHRHDHVTRRIHKLHPMHPRVIAMSVARAMGVAFVLKRVQQSVRLVGSKAEERLRGASSLTASAGALFASSPRCPA